MTLQEGLLRKLNDANEPLPKRLKIADNAFKCPEVNFQDREFFFLKWIIQEEISDKNIESWQQCQTWLASDNFKELRSTDLTSEEIHDIFQAIAKQFELKDPVIQSTLISVIMAILESPVFQIYLRNNVDVYMEFLKNIFNNIDDIEMMLQFLKQDKILSKKVVVAVDFHNIFMKHLFMCFVNACVRFSLKEDELFNVLVHYVQRFVFAKREEEFVASFKQLETDPKTIKDVEILNILIESLPKSKPINNLKFYFYHKLLYQSFCKCYKQNLSLLYGLFTLLLENLGFSNEAKKSSNNFDNSLISIIGLLEVIANNSIKFDNMSINKVTFPTLIQSLLLSILSITKAPVNENCYKIINLIITIHPLTIEAVIIPLLVYLMSNNNENNELLYVDTLINTFDVFHKLHRVPNLISKLIRGLQPRYLNMTSLETKGEVLNFNGKVPETIVDHTEYLELDIDKILPFRVLEHFNMNVIATKLINNIFKTLLYHMDEMVGQDLVEKSKDNKYVTFMEIISRLLCHYMSKTNLGSSNFRIEIIKEKFSAYLEELQVILEKFGTALLEIEHNQNLMCVFLNLSYTWGELKIFIQYVILNETISNELSELDGTSCNISFLHSYLPSKSWCMIAERISNFGEEKCKHIMEKLWIQKIRALILSNIDKSMINEHIATLIKSIAPIEDYYEYLLSNEFASYGILSKIDSETLVSIANCVLNDALQNDRILKNVLENERFVLALVYSIFKKINKFFKKESKTNGKEMASCVIFNFIEANFVDGEEWDVENFKEHFKNTLTNKLDISVIATPKLKEYLCLIRKLPIVHLKKHSQMIMFSYLMSVFLDLKKCDENTEVLKDFENLLLGLTQTKAISLDLILPLKLMIKLLLKEFNNSQVIFPHILKSDDNDSAILSKTIDVLRKQLNNEKYVKCLRILLKYVHKTKKATDFDINESVCDSLLQTLIESNSSLHLEVLIEFLQINKDFLANNVIKQLETLINRIFTDVNMEIGRGELLLFQFVFNNYEKFQTNTDSITNEEEFTSNVSKAIQRVKLIKDCIDFYSSNVLLILQKISSLEEFKTIVDYLLTQTLTSIEDPDNVEHLTKIWGTIISSTMKTNKGEIIQKSVETIIVTLYKYTTKNNCDTKYYGVLLNFLLHVIQNNQHLLTSTSLDLCFATITQLKNMDQFEQFYTQSINILEALLRYRQPLICDRLPIFLQYYRILLSSLCSKSNTNMKFDVTHYEKCAELAHLLEKLTINLCKLQEHLASVSLYLIADILKEYETITIYPAVKLSLNNCLYNLLPLCDKHGRACLMRVLSPGSTEIFKGVYEDFKKYHRFTGKV